MQTNYAQMKRIADIFIISKQKYVLLQLQELERFVGQQDSCFI